MNETDITNAIHYNGKVKVDLYRNNKLYKSTNYKNLGRWPLFYFIANCLAGDYNSVAPYKPNFVKLFTLGNKGDSIPTNKEIETSKFIEDNLCSSGISFGVTKSALTETIKSFNIDETSLEENKSDESAIVTYQFVIPYTQIDTTRDINLIALYSSAKLSELNEPSAYIVIKNEDDTALDSILPTGTQTKNNDYTLIITWSLSIHN